MKQFSNISSYTKPTIATIGFFDGVHLGHQFLLKELIKEGAISQLETLVISFKNHPQKFLNPSSDLKFLNTLEEKITRLEKLGIQNTLLLDFDNSISEMTSEEFLIFLRDRFSVKKLLIGYDHHFGSDKEKDTKAYLQIGKKIGIDIKIYTALSKNHLEISSSKIRSFLKNGLIDSANNFLGYNYSINGTVISGNQIGRKIGFPTANLEISDEKLLPQKGVYAVRLELEGEEFKGMLNIGSRPTIEGKEERVEVHILNFEKDIYGKKVTVSFEKKIREEKKFNSLKELQKQLKEDKSQIK